MDFFFPDVKGKREPFPYGYIKRSNVRFLNATGVGVRNPSWTDQAEGTA